MVVVRNLKIIGLTKICITAIIFTLSVGCSVIENSHRQKMPMMSAFAAGNNEIATDEIRSGFKVLLFSTIPSLTAVMN